MARRRLSAPRWLTKGRGKRKEELLRKTLLFFEKRDEGGMKKLRKFQDGEYIFFIHIELLDLEVKSKKKKRSIDLDDVLRNVAPRLHEAVLARQLGMLCFLETPIEKAKTFKGDRASPIMIKKIVDITDLACRLPSLELIETGKTRYHALKEKLRSGKIITRVALWDPFYAKRKG